MEDSADGELSPIGSSSGDELLRSPLFGATEPVEEKQALWAISNNPEFYAPRGLCLPPLTPRSSVGGRQHPQSPSHSPDLDVCSQASHDDAFSEGSHGQNNSFHMDHLRAACNRLDPSGNLESRRTSLSTRSQQGDGDSQTLKRQLTSWQDTAAGFKADIAAMTVERDRLYAEVKVLQSRLGDSEAARRRMREEMLDERSRFETRIELLQAERNTRVAKLSHENAALQYRVQELMTQVESMSRASREVSRSSESGVSVGVGSMRMDSVREERDQLREQLRAREAELDKRTGEVQEWARLRAETAERASKLAEENSSLLAKLAAATLELSQVQQHLQTEQQQREAVPGTVALDELLREKQHCEKAAEEANRQRQLAEDSNRQLTEEAKRQRQLAEEANRQLAELKAMKTFGANEALQAREELRQLTQDVALLTDSLAAKTQELAQLQKQKNQDDQAHQVVISEYQSRLEAMAQQRDELAQRLEDTERALMEEREMRAEDVRRKEAALEALGAKVVQLTNNRTEAIEKLQQEKAHLEMALRSELESQVGQLQSVNDQLAAKLSERMQELAQVREHMEKSEEAADELRTVNKQLLGKVADLAQSVTELRMAKGNPMGGGSSR